MDELARILLQKEGELARDSVAQSRTPAGGTRAVRKAVAKGGLLLKGNNSRNVPPFTYFHGLTLTTLHPLLQIQRQEDDIRARVQVSLQAYHKSVQETQALRQEYFNLRLPQILRVRASKPPGCRDFSHLYSFLGFERVCGRIRLRNTIPPRALCYLIRKNCLERRIDFGTY